MATEQLGNKAVNQPSGKKPEWEKGEKPKPKKGRKRKLGGKRKGAGNKPKKDLVPDQHVHNELEDCSDCATDLTEQTGSRPNR